MNALDLIVEVARTQLGREVVAGNNGPHNHKETDVRNSSHWAIAFMSCYRFTGDPKFMQEAEVILDRIVTNFSASNWHNFYHRDVPGKDRCNGLIGPAWTIEALLMGATVLREERLRALAERVAVAHPYSRKSHLWGVLDVDGTTGIIDSTFNHQLWFGVSVAEMALSVEEMAQRIEDFFNNLQENLTVLGNGLIFHPIERDVYGSVSASWMKSKLRGIGIRPTHIVLRVKGDREFRRLIDVSYGYHVFNLYAFARLSQTFPDMLRRSGVSLRGPLELLASRAFSRRVQANRYGYPYNALGFEAPYVIESLMPDRVDVAQRFLADQVKMTYCSESVSFARSTPDPRTLTARIYELGRCSEKFLKQIEVGL